MAAEYGLFIRWGAPFVDREEMSIKVFMSAIQYYARLKEKGEIEDFHIYIDETGNLHQQGGTMIIDGTADQLAKMREDDEYLTLVMQANHVVTNFTLTMTYTGNKVMERIEKLQVVRKDLGI